MECPIDEMAFAYLKRDKKTRNKVEGNQLISFDNTTSGSTELVSSTRSVQKSSQTVDSPVKTCMLVSLKAPGFGAVLQCENALSVVARRACTVKWGAIKKKKAPSV